VLPAGKTPLDIALEMRCVAIVRNLERSALFTGYVNMKVRSGTCKGLDMALPCTSLSNAP
jgi:hypothetical protein